MMKEMKMLPVWIMGFLAIACQENEASESELTGKEVVYSLQPGSVYAISGTITFKERKDGFTHVYVNLTGTEGNMQHPVHLHLGNISAPDADIAGLLNPVIGSTGKSETHLKQLSNEDPISFNELIKLNASIKIHLAESGPDRNIILAAGNIGTAVQSDPGGRFGISICKSE